MNYEPIIQWMNGYKRGREWAIDILNLVSFKTGYPTGVCYKVLSAKYWEAINELHNQRNKANDSTR